MSGIENTRKAVNEEALPKSKAIKTALGQIAETNYSAAKHLEEAKKGVVEHVLPHLLAAIATQEGIRGLYIDMGTDAIDVNRVAKKSLGDSELGGQITATIRSILEKLPQDTRNHMMTYGMLEEDVPRVEALERRLGVASHHFFAAEHNAKEHIDPLSNIIERLENFEV